MGFGSNNMDLLAAYQDYNPDFMPQRSAPMQPASQGSGLAAALPFVQAGLSGVGLLSSLYGNYQAGKIADRNYRLQKRQFDYQQRLEEQDRMRKREQEDLANTYTAADRADQQDNRLLSRYAGYYRGIGL